MKVLIYFILVFATFCSKGQADLKLLNEDWPTPVKVKVIKFVHIDYELKSDAVQAGQTIGRIQKFPERLSERYSNAIAQSEQSYKKGDYSRAASLLDRPYQGENKNPFILNDYARALYKTGTDNQKCYSVYKQLVAQLDSNFPNSDTVLVVDLWFREAYWKLGTLHMDNGHWVDAMVEIGRFMSSMADETKSAAYEQALGYLTECAYMTGNAELCRHFAKRTLFYNPQNKYVLEFTGKLTK